MFLVLTAEDSDGSRRFYERLGYAFTQEKHPGGPTHLTMVVPSMAVEIYPPTAALQGAQTQYLGVYVDDPEGTKTDLIANFGGREPEPAIPTSRAGTTSLNDPDGRLVRLFKQS
jgi:hypothetical protein